MIRRACSGYQNMICIQKSFYGLVQKLFIYM